MTYNPENTTYRHVCRNNFKFGGLESRKLKVSLYMTIFKGKSRTQEREGGTVDYSGNNLKVYNIHHLLIALVLYWPGL